MTAFLLVCAGTGGLLFLAGWFTRGWYAERRRPADNRPAKRTGRAGRGPARSHYMPAHPVANSAVASRGLATPRPPLAADPDATFVAVPVKTQPIAASPLARRRAS